jgi:hypothetical protein
LKKTKEQENNIFKLGDLMHYQAVADKKDTTEEILVNNLQALCVICHTYPERKCQFASAIEALFIPLNCQIAA